MVRRLKPHRRRRPRPEMRAQAVSEVGTGPIGVRIAIGFALMGAREWD